MFECLKRNRPGTVTKRDKPLHLTTQTAHTSSSKTNAVRLLPQPETQGSSRFGSFVIHVTSAASVDEKLRTIKINSGSPKSDVDFFVLNACRAAADYIVTTGEILRREPQLSTLVQGPSRADLLEWRHSLGKDGPARTVIMTQRENINAAHPIFHQEGEKLIYTSTESCKMLEVLFVDQLAAGGLDIISRDKPSLNDLLGFLSNKDPELCSGTCVISIEAGPTASNALYSECDSTGSSLPDMLLLSEYRCHLEDSQVSPSVSYQFHIRNVDC